MQKFKDNTKIKDCQTKKCAEILNIILCITQVNVTCINVIHNNVNHMLNVSYAITLPT